jgi:lipopolysaccharide transport system ATP-binding protein
MSEIAIRVENLSKQYRIGGPQASYKTIRESLVGAARAPFRRLASVARGHSSADTHETIWALKDVSFEVKHGEVLGIIGRNGAGKSTLLKILSRITAPTEGTVDLYGRVGSLLEVGTGFHPELTGRENIYLNGAILGMTRAEIERRFDEIVAFAELEKFLDTPVKHYSSGMYVRLAFAVAAHLDPEILLVDEVLAVGDAAFQKKCLGKMGTIAKEGRTVLFVSHNLIALRSLCPRAVWLDNGGLRRDDHSPDVVAEYLKPQGTKVYGQNWDDPANAPGTEAVRLHRVWVEPENGLSAAGIPREVPFTIGVEFWHLDPMVQLHVTLHVYVEQQTVAFTTASADDPTWQKSARRPGLLRSVCRIPAHFLNTGQHRVNLLMVKNRSRVVHILEDALSFDVVETAERTGSWFGKEPGVLRPQLPWTNEFLGSGLNHAAKEDRDR